MQILNPDIYSDNNIAQYKKIFENGRPFKNLRINDFLSIDAANHLADHFPGMDKMRKKYDGINERKAEDANFAGIDIMFSELKRELASSGFLKWLEQVSGLNELFTVEDQRGAGLHQGANGSFLDIHIDFNIHPLLNVHRRLNLIIFLNKQWQTEWGGNLEFWDSKVKQCVTNYPPLFNDAIIFETNEISYHGYSMINVPAGITRKSYYNYFYTTRQLNVKYHDTVFKVRPNEGVLKAVMTTVKDLIKNNAKRGFRLIGLTTWFKKIE